MRDWFRGGSEVWVGVGVLRPLFAYDAYERAGVEVQVRVRG